MRNLLWQSDAWAEYQEIQSDKALLKRINRLVKDLMRNGYDSSYGKVEMLKGDFSGYASVRIDKKNRIIFRVDEFQLTKQEYENLRCQFGISSQDDSDTEHGGRRYMPYVFTEPGISMLASVLRSEVAVNVSISIMRAFVEMRRFIASNAALFERISSVELKQLEYQKQTDEKFDKVFEYIDDHAESEQKIFFLKR